MIESVEVRSSEMVESEDLVAGSDSMAWRAAAPLSGERHAMMIWYLGEDVASTLAVAKPTPEFAPVRREISVWNQAPRRTEGHPELRMKGE